MWGRGARVNVVIFLIIIDFNIWDIKNDLKMVSNKVASIKFTVTFLL